MDNTNSKICKEFESELWLFLDDSIEEQSRDQWNTHISQCPRCSTVLKETRATIDLYDNLPLDDIKNSFFNKIIKKVVASEKNSVIADISPSIQKNRTLAEIFGFYKLAFGGSVLAAALIFIFITFFENPKIPDIKNQIPKELLDWNALDINNRLINVEDQIISLQTNDWEIYIVRKNKKEKWSSALRGIQKQIRKMRKEVVSKSM